MCCSGSGRHDHGRGRAARGRDGAAGGLSGRAEPVPAAPRAAAWPATTHAREQVLGQLTGVAAGQQRIAGIEALLDWLEDQEGGSWQERWLASGAEALGAAWLQLPAQWLHQRAGARTGGRACCPGRWPPPSAAISCARRWPGW